MRYEVFQWLGLVLVIPPNLFILFDYLSGAASYKKILKGFWMIGIQSFGLFGTLGT